MKRITVVLTVLMTLLCLSIALANPSLPGYINELVFNAGSWTIETDEYLPTTTLDGWALSSRSGTSAFKSGIQVGNQAFTLLTPGSLLTPLTIDSLGDSLTMKGPGTTGTYILTFGDGPACDVRAPQPGWSISHRSTYYLDQSPTLGAVNDKAGAMVTVRGVVRDSATHAPLSGAIVEEWVTISECKTSDSGSFSLTLYAHNGWILASLPGYGQRKVVLSLLPGQTVDTVIYLSRVTSVAQSGVPQVFSLLQNYPNPFNPSTTIFFTLPVSGKVTLDVYDPLGKEIAELIRGFRSTGEYRVVWNGTDENGRPLGSGVYLARLRVTEGNAGLLRERTIKLLLIR